MLETSSGQYLLIHKVPSVSIKYSSYLHVLIFKKSFKMKALCSSNSFFVWKNTKKIQFKSRNLQSMTSLRLNFENEKGQKTTTLLQTFYIAMVNDLC